MARETTSRGVHFRRDFPELNDDQFRGHFTLRNSTGHVECAFEAIRT